MWPCEFRRATSFPRAASTRQTTSEQGGGDGGPTTAGERRMARRRPRRPSPVPRLHPPVRARRRRHARRGRRRLRDVGRRSTTATATPSCCATRGPATATPSARWVTAIRAPGWWEGVVGPGLAIDTDRWFVVCANVLGGCQGSTGPASPHPDRRQAVRLAGSRSSRSATWCARRRAWPTTSAIAGVALGRSAARWAGCRCSSGRSRSRIGCARSCRSPRARRRRRSRSRGARSAAGRSASIPNWRGGDYYDADAGDGPWEGLAVARMVAQVTFRSDNVFTDRFGRELADGATLRRQLRPVAALRGRALPRPPRREARPPLRRQQLPHHRQGDGPARRRPAAAAASSAAMARIKVPTLTIGISSDMLYPSYQQRQIRDLLRRRRHAVRVRRDRLTARPRRVPDQPRSAVGTARRVRRIGRESLAG